MGKRLSWPAWSMCRWVCRIQRTSLGVRSYSRELVLELHLLGHVAGHAQPVHDLGVARAGVDKDGLLAAEDEEPERRDLRSHPHVAPEHQEARLDVDVDEAQKLDLQGHANSPL